MEVHAHTHTERKKFIHYLWEFFMLFLAVFCGFLAENQREHIIEHKRELQYMKLMLADLAADTLLLNDQQEELKQRWVACDSLFYLLQNKNLKDSGSSIYYYGRQVGFYKRQLSLSTRTLDQLKSGRMFRLIRNQNVADSISKYDEKKNEYETWIKVLFDEIKNIQNENKQLFDTKIFETATVYYDTIGIKLPVKGLNANGNPPLLTYDAGFLQRYYNAIYYLKKLIEASYLRLFDCKQMNESLFEIIKKEYHLN